jgi:hypothetical protein
MSLGEHRLEWIKIKHKGFRPPKQITVPLVKNEFLTAQPSSCEDLIVKEWVGDVMFWGAGHVG